MKERGDSKDSLERCEVTPPVTSQPVMVSTQFPKAHKLEVSLRSIRAPVGGWEPTGHSSGQRLWYSMIAVFDSHPYTLSIQRHLMNVKWMVEKLEKKSPI